MAALAIVSFLIGAMLARRHVLVLLPALVAGSVFLTALAAATDMSLAQGALAGVLLAIGLQLGYAAGVLGDFFVLAANRAPRLRGNNDAIARGRS
jgi:hypothetical protein